MEEKIARYVRRNEQNERYMSCNETNLKNICYNNLNNKEKEKEKAKGKIKGKVKIHINRTIIKRYMRIVFNSTNRANRKKYLTSFNKMLYNKDRK